MFLGFGFRVPVFELHISGLEFRASFFSCSVFRVSGSGFRKWDVESGVSGVRFRVWGFGLAVGPEKQPEEVAQDADRLQVHRNSEVCQHLLPQESSLLTTYWSEFT